MEETETEGTLKMEETETRSQRSSLDLVGSVQRVTKEPERYLGALLGALLGGLGASVADPEADASNQ